jgi:hypothetical protein
MIKRPNKAVKGSGRRGVFFLGAKRELIAEVGVGSQDSGVRRKKPQIVEPKVGVLRRFENRILDRHSWLLTPSILTPFALALS